MRRYLLVIISVSGLICCIIFAVLGYILVNHIANVARGFIDLDPALILFSVLIGSTLLLIALWLSRAYRVVSDNSDRKFFD